MENLNEGKKGKPNYMAELAEIDTQSAIVAMEAKISKLEEMAKAKETRLEMVSEDENLSELISKSAVKEMQKEIKEIRKMQEKLKKVYEKKNGKKPVEVVDEEEKMVKMKFRPTVYNCPIGIHLAVLIKMSLMEIKELNKVDIKVVDFNMEKKANEYLKSIDNINKKEEQ